LPFTRLNTTSATARTGAASVDEIRVFARIVKKSPASRILLSPFAATTSFLDLEQNPEHACESNDDKPLSKWTHKQTIGGPPIPKADTTTCR